MSAKLDIVRRVNAEINRLVVYLDDIRRWGLEEYWPTTGEALAMLDGRLAPCAEDCDGQAIAKCALLWSGHGFSEAELTLAAGWVLAGRSGGAEGHMVALFWESETDPWVLDNGAVSEDVERLSYLPQLVLDVAFNRTQAWKINREAA